MTHLKLWLRAASPALVSTALAGCALTLSACSEEDPAATSTSGATSDGGTDTTGGTTMGGAMGNTVNTVNTVSTVTTTTASTTGTTTRATMDGTTGGTTGTPIGGTTGGMTSTDGGMTSTDGGMTSTDGGMTSTTGGTTGGTMGGAGGMGNTTDTTSTDGGTTDGGTTGGDDINSGPDTMGWIGCSMGENTATGYRRIGGTRMWGPYGNGGAVVQNWTNNNGPDWGRFDNQVAQHGMPKAVWIMICIFPTGATIQEVRQMVANTKEHAPGAFLYITGQPLYDDGHTCSLAGGAGGPESTDELAKQLADEDPDVVYGGTFGPLGDGTVNAGDSTGCHASAEGEDFLGQQAKDKWGQP